jgi:hypothetical protein
LLIYQTKVFCYAINPITTDDGGSAVRAATAAAAEHFVDINAMSPSEAAARIAEDGVQVLLNLGGYTQHMRNEIFALQPAPLQVLPLPNSPFFVHTPHCAFRITTAKTTCVWSGRARSLLQLTLRVNILCACFFVSKVLIILSVSSARPHPDGVGRETVSFATATARVT